MNLEELKEDLRKSYKELKLYPDEGERPVDPDFLSNLKLANFIWETLGKIDGQEDLPSPPSRTYYSYWTGSDGEFVEEGYGF